MTGRDDHDPAGERGAFAYTGLDRALHEKARLGILTALMARSEGASFVELKHLCDLTDGNLNRHLKVLEEAGLVRLHKARLGGRPSTSVRLSPAGRRAFLAYLDELERVVRDARALESDADPDPGLGPARA